MDFQELLNHADYNASEVRKASVKRYSSVLPPPKKVPKANVQSENIKRFLEKKKKEEEAKVAEARKEKERLLALRAQNSKNNKKAKIMASRTKDNDFSRIKLTDDELEAKKRREDALLRKNLADKKERMKARIEMEEKEMLMPRKRKRKSKSNEPLESLNDHDDELQNGYEESNSNTKSTDDNNKYQKDKIKKPKPPPPVMNYSDLLKIAEKRQGAPVEIVVKKKEEEKLMTKKEKKLKEEELARQRRKQERLLQAENNKLPKVPVSASAAPLNRKAIPEKEDSKKPVVIHVGKDISKSDQDAKFKIPKSTLNTSTNKNIPGKYKDANSNLNYKSVSSSNPVGKAVKSFSVNEQKKVKSKNEADSSLKNTDVKNKIAVPKKNELKSNSVQVIPRKEADSGPTFDETALKAKIEEEVRAKMERELASKMEAMFAARFAQLQNSQPSVTEKVIQAPKQVMKEPTDRARQLQNSQQRATEKEIQPLKQIKKEPAVTSNISKKPVEKSSGIYKKDMERMIEMRKQAMAKSSLKLPEKKPFHKNPYLDPPRRLLEPQRPHKPPMKRRIESDDDDDDDDDMSDFIVDGPSQNEEDYSKYIKEIFGYDRNRYLDDDDDDVMETSFAEQMKEEVRSARLGYLEDLEEEKLELERQKRKKRKK